MDWKEIIGGALFSYTLWKLIDYYTPPTAIDPQEQQWLDEAFLIFDPIGTFAQDIVGGLIDDYTLPKAPTNVAGTVPVSSVGV